MSLSVLAQGTIAREPEARTGESGKPFALSALLIEGAGPEGEALYANLIAFGSAAEELLAKHKGDALAVGGRAKLRTWTARDGEQKFALSVTVESLLGIEPRANQSSRTKKTPSSAEQHSEPTVRQQTPKPTGGKFDDMEDDIPF